MRTFDAFLHHIDQIAPGHGLGPDDPLDSLAPYRRLAITRWLSDCLEQPVDLEIVRRFGSLAQAWAWLDESLAGGERLRPHGERAHGGATTRVRLRPLLDGDVLPLYLASFDPATSSTWRYRGRTVPIEEFVAGLADGVRAQFAVEVAGDGAAIGLVTAYDHHQSGLHCKVGLVRFGRVPGDRDAVLEGLVLLISHLFRSFPYRKVYIELPAYNLRLLEPQIFEVEGVLRDYLFHDGRPVDLHLASLSRARWQELSDATGW